MPVLAVLLALAYAPVAHAKGARLFVARAAGCSDARAAAAKRSTPLCSVARAVAIAPSGARIALHGGSYPRLSLGPRPARRGPVTITAATPRAHVALGHVHIHGGASNIRFRDVTLSEGIEVDGHSPGSGHISIVNSRILRTNGSDGVLLGWGTHDVVIRGNYIHTTNGANGITLNSTSRRPNVPDPRATDEPPISNVVIRNNHIDGVGTDAIRPANFDHLLIEGNEIDGVVENGDHSDALQVVWGGDHLTFRNNYVHDDRGQGFFIKDGRVTDVDFENNVFVGATGDFYQFSVYDVIGLKMFNNTIWGNHLNAIFEWGNRDVVMRNNLIEALTTEGEGREDPRRFVSDDHNLIGSTFRWGARGPHDIHRRPRFVDPGHGDYRLAPHSPGIDAGTGVGAPAVDKACHRRWDDPAVRNRGDGTPNYVDMGALERAPGSSPGDTSSAGCGRGAPPHRSHPHGRRCGVRGLHARLDGHRVVVLLRATRQCRVAVAARVRWHAGHRRRSAKLHGLGHRRLIHRGRRRLTINVSPRVRRAIRQHRAALSLRLRPVGGHWRTASLPIHRH